MGICITAVAGLCISAFGALFSALPCRGLDSLVRWPYREFRLGNSGLHRLRRNGEITHADGELAALNRLLGTKADSLRRVEENGVWADETTGAIAPGHQLVVDEGGNKVGAIDLIQSKLDRKIRDARTYVGLVIVAIGFGLQAIAIWIC